MEIRSKNFVKTYIALFVVGAIIIGASLLGFDRENNVSTASLAAAQETFYTCPIHPIIVEEEPGDCPICGMELTPKKGELERDPSACRPGLDKEEGECKEFGKEKEKEDGATLYSCGMHPNVIQEEPGDCPICGMKLTPLKKAGGKKSGANSKEGAIVEIDPVVVQNMGVRIEHVKRQDIFRHIRTIGEIDIAEDEISAVNLRFSGWVERIFADQSLAPIKRGEKLFEVYSPEVLTAQEEYLHAIGISGKEGKLTKAAAKRLLLWGIPQAFLDEIEEEGNARRTIVVRAPRSGYILNKNIVEGAHIRAGTDLYRIGNFQKIWVNAEIYEYDAPWVELGQKATLELSHWQGRVWEGKISYIYPTVNRKSRTLTVRLEFPNPGIRLKPGMFATVRIEVEKKENSLVVPSEAIIHSGERRIVFIAAEYGRYESREITAGLIGDNRKTEILSGLKEGEAVVISGQFLLDSESQLQEAIQKMLSDKLHGKSRSAGGAHIGHNH